MSTTQARQQVLEPGLLRRYLGFDKPPHLWGGWAEAEYLDLEMLPGTKIYRLPDYMPLWLGTLAEPLSSSIHGLKRAQEMGCFAVGDTVVIQGSGPIGALAIVAAREMGAGRVFVVGAPEEPRLSLCRKFGAEATVDIGRYDTPERRITAAREIVGGFGADVVIECSGHPSSGPEGIEMLRDGGTYIEMGQFTNAGSIDTNWHRICVKAITVIGSWAFTADDIALGDPDAPSSGQEVSLSGNAEEVSLFGRGHPRGGRGGQGDGVRQSDDRAQP